MSQSSTGVQRKWKREEVEAALREMLVDALGVAEERVVPGASLVHDLGAESIDFLDIAFRVQQAFGVELPNKAIQEKAISWRNLDELRRILEDRYGVRVQPDEVRQFHTLGVPGVLNWLVEKKGVAIQNGEAEKIARQLADCFVSEVESAGFNGSLVDRDSTVQLLLNNLNSPKLMEGMIRLFSVGALVDFISARIGER